MQPIRMSPDHDPISTPNEFVILILTASETQMAGKLAANALESEEAVADFRLSTIALNYHRVEWRLKEELPQYPAVLLEKIKAVICQRKGYEPEEFDAALIATRDRPRLPYGWTAMDLAQRRLASKPLKLLNPELEASRYAKGIIGLAVYLQQIQKDEPILLPVEQVREVLAAKKVVVAGTITKLIELGLLEMTKADYHTGSAREFKFRGVEGKDYEFVSALGPREQEQK